MNDDLKLMLKNNVEINSFHLDQVGDLKTSRQIKKCNPNGQ